MKILPLNKFYNHIPDLETGRKIAVADWLVSNSILTENQISQLTGLNEYEVRKIFNDTYVKSHLPINPIKNDFISKELLDTLESDATLGIIRLEDFNSKLEDFDIDEVIPSEIEEINMSKIYFLYQGHNAWWGTWSSRFIQNHTLHTSLISSEKYAEYTRTQGRVFSIDQIPAITLHLKDKIIYIVSINQEYSPFSIFQEYYNEDYENFSDIMRILKRINEISKYPKFLFFALNKRVIIPELDDDLNTYRSQVIGPNLQLQFQKQELKISLEKVKKFHQLLKDIVFKNTKL